MENSKLTEIFLEVKDKTLKQINIETKNQKSRLKLGDLLSNPLKANQRLNILNQANKLSKQMPFLEGIYKIIAYFEKNKLNFENFISFNLGIYNKYNKLPHCERVLVFATLIAVLQNLQPRDLQIVIDSAKFHDVGRNTSESDVMHGRKSVGMIKYYNMVYYENPRDYNALYAIVDSHSADDKTLGNILNRYNIDLSNYKKVKNMCNILKDAEALDKVRFFNDSAVSAQKMLNANLLKTKEGKSLVKFAFELNDFYSKL